MSTIKRAAAAIGFVGLSSFMMLGAANATPPTGTSADYGMQVVDSAATRTISINAFTKYVNVTDGETVRFDVDGKSFTWHFDGYPNQTSLELSKIAPEGINVGSLRVYVAANPLYQN